MLFGDFIFAILLFIYAEFSYSVRRNMKPFNIFEKLSKKFLELLINEVLSWIRFYGKFYFHEIYSSSKLTVINQKLFAKTLFPTKSNKYLEDYKLYCLLALILRAGKQLILCIKCITYTFHKLYFLQFILKPSNYK